MSEWEQGFWVRHRDLYFVTAVRNHLGIRSGIQEVKSKTGPQYRLKIVRQETVQDMHAFLQEQGWQPRKALERQYPNGPVNHRGFIRAWVELHGGVDIRQSKNRNGSYSPQRRLRIYGNHLLMEEINEILCHATGLSPRRLQATQNEITKCIYFQGGNVQPVLNWLYDGAEIWNPDTKDKLQI
jgi:hypothetical protein